MSIYSSLFAYRPTPKRVPEEDFLTAALADLLNGLSQERLAEFVANVLFDGTTSETWRKFMAGGLRGPLRWQIQRRVLS